MLSLSRKDRCKSCHTERALRMCPRTQKGFCWKCCNELRVDLKCPQDCPYKPRFDAESPFPAFKADNNREATQAIKNFIGLWINKENPAFNNYSPKQMAETDKNHALEILSSYQYPGNFPVEYLMQKLGIEPEIRDMPAYAEDTVSEYLDHIIALDFSQLRKLTTNDSPLPDLAERYGEIISKISAYQKLKKYSFIHTGLSEDATQAIVFIEVNLRDEMCFVLRRHDKQWLIRQCIMGNPALYFKQNEVFQRIAGNLAEAKAQSAYAEILEALRSYPDCADIYYYRALYWLLAKDTNKAKLDFFSSIALDNSFAPPYMNLGMVNLNEKNYPEAELWFAALCSIDPDNKDAANNLGIAFIAQGKKEDARKIWREILNKDPNYEMARKNLELYG